VKKPSTHDEVLVSMIERIYRSAKKMGADEFVGLVENVVLSELMTKLKRDLKEAKKLIARLQEQEAEHIRNTATQKTFEDALQTAGIHRLFGGNIDIDFDLFVDALQPPMVADLAKVISEKREMSLAGQAA
jgi:hypothetical protein